MADFLNTWAMPLGVAGLAIPFVIHWLTRPRPVLMPLSTVRFVIEALKQNSWWHRLRDWLLLLLRTAAVALIAAAMARPLLSTKPNVSSGNAVGVVRVVVLDVSQSMAAIENGIPVFERGRAEAASYLRHGSGSRANLILAGATPRSVFPHPSNNLSALRKQLSDAQPLHEQLDLERTIESATEMLAAADAGTEPELVIVSDFQRGNWVSADFSPLPAQTKIELVSVAAAVPPANAAVTSVRCDQRPSADRPVPVQIEVANFSPQARTFAIQLSAGEQVEMADVLCDANGRATIRLPIRMGATGWQPVVAELADHQDALHADDRRSLVVEVRRSPRLALLTREDPQRAASASYFIDRALTAHDRRDGRQPIAVSWQDPSSIKPDALVDVDGAVVVRPGRIAEVLAQRLVRFMRSGRPLLYIAHDVMDAHNLQQLVTLAGSDLEPPATFAPPPRSARRDNLFLADLRARAAPFAAFGDRLSPLLSPLRFSGGLTSRRNPRALPEEVLASYSDNSVCLYMTPCAAGSLAVWNVDLVASNLPGSPAFVPWVGEIARQQLARRASRGAATSGERLVERLPSDVRDPALVDVVGPQGTDGPFGILRATDQGVLWDWEPAGTPGVYRVVEKEDPSNIVYAASVVLPTIESDLAAIDAKLLEGRLAGGRSMHFQAAGRGKSHEDSAWSWLAAACAGCLLLEFLALGAYRV